MQLHALAPVLFAASLASTLGCATYRDELARGQNTLEQGQQEKALAIFRRLDHDQGHFDDAEQARYAYLRGMTDARIGYRADARHWLAVARAIDAQHQGALSAAQKKKLAPTLAELDTQVYAHGIASLDKPAERPHHRARAADQDEPARKAQPTDEKDAVKADPPGD